MSVVGLLGIVAGYSAALLLWLVLLRLWKGEFGAVVTSMAIVIAISSFSIGALGKGILYTMFHRWDAGDIALTALVVIVFIAFNFSAFFVVFGAGFAERFGNKWIKSLDLAYVILACMALVGAIIRLKAPATEGLEEIAVVVGAHAVGIRLAKSILELFFEARITK